MHSKLCVSVLVWIGLATFLFAPQPPSTAQQRVTPEPPPIDATEEALASAVAASAYALNETADYQPLLDLIGDARVVLIGEASHGTSEFYQRRAELTRLLIEERGFTAVAVEADWHSAYRLNEYVHGLDPALQIEDAFDAFTEFPLWMWRNTVVRDFILWLRDHNQQLPPDEPTAGFYGLDLYGLYGSIDEVIENLEATHALAAQRARNRYRCFVEFGDDPQTYGYTAAREDDQSCSAQAASQLADLLQDASELLLHPEAALSLEQNARVVVNADSVLPYAVRRKRLYLESAR